MGGLLFLLLIKLLVKVAPCWQGDVLHSAGGGGSRSQSLPCAAAVRARVQGCVFQHSYGGASGVRLKTPLWQ